MVTIMFITNSNYGPNDTYIWKREKGNGVSTYLFLNDPEVHVFFRYDKNWFKYYGIIDTSTIVQDPSNPSPKKAIGKAKYEGQWSFKLIFKGPIRKRLRDQTACANALGYYIVPGRCVGVYELKPHRQ